MCPTRSRLHAWVDPSVLWPTKTLTFALRGSGLSAWIALSTLRRTTTHFPDEIPTNYLSLTALHMTSPCLIC